MPAKIPAEWWQELVPVQERCLIPKPWAAFRRVGESALRDPGGDRPVWHENHIYGAVVGARVSARGAS